MNKDEILKKARDEKTDEGLENASYKGLSLGYKIFLILILVFIIINFIADKFSHDLICLLWAFIAAENYTRYKFTKEKSYKSSLIASLIISVASFINYIIVTF